MNDLEIKDISKLKNLLIEFGVEFEETTIDDRIYVDIPIEGENFPHCFRFESTGKFYNLS